MHVCSVSIKRLLKEVLKVVAGTINHSFISFHYEIKISFDDTLATVSRVVLSRGKMLVPTSVILLFIY